MSQTQTQTHTHTHTHTHTLASARAQMGRGNERGRERHGGGGCGAGSTRVGDNGYQKMNNQPTDRSTLPDGWLSGLYVHLGSLHCRSLQLLVSFHAEDLTRKQYIYIYILRLALTLHELGKSRKEWIQVVQQCTRHSGRPCI